MPYSFPIEQPLPSGGYEFCHGPVSIGNTTIQQYTDRWVAWNASTGIRVAKWTPGMVLNETEGTANNLFTGGEKPAKFSFAFEQDALYALAYNTAVDTITLRRLVSSIVTTYTWTGRSPILFYNGLLISDTGITDLVCFYIKSTGTAIYARVQRENFGVEHTFNGTLNTTLRELRKTDRVRIDGLNYQVLWAVSTIGQQVFYLSPPYTPIPQYAADAGTLDVCFCTAELFAPIVTSTATEFGTLDITVNATGSSYFSTIVTTFAPGDLSTLDVKFSSGVYGLIIVVTQAPGDFETLDVAFSSGAYTLTAVPSDAPDDFSTLDVKFSSGAMA